LAPTPTQAHLETRNFSTFLLAAAWFGILTGLVEGAGLLLFQRINWANWGPMLHVSAPILWISPVFDLIFFLALAVTAALIARIAPRWPMLRALIFLLSFLAIYDFLTLTARLYHWSCFLLAIGVGAAFTRWFSQHETTALHFARRTVLGLVAAGILAFVAVQGGGWWVEKRELAQLPPSVPNSPNVLVIVIDTLRADHLSSYGYGRSTTPNIDRMAKQGTLFENAISTCSWSLPSHVSMLTGLYQFQHGVSNVQAMPIFGAPSLGGHLMLGEALERRGYRTGAFSANRTWFDHDLGFGRGFIHFEDYFHSPADALIRTLFGREFSRIYLSRTDRSKPKRFLRWLGFDWLLDPDDEGVGVEGGAPGIRKRAPVVNAELLHWIDNSTEGHPFFAFLNYFDVHSPYGGPRAYAKPWPGSAVVDPYDDGVRYVDDAVGTLMAQLERRGLDRNTIVVITGDHGEGLGQHGLPTHGQALYREQIQVPLIFWYPGHIPSGERIARSVTNAAIPATVMEVVGGKGESDFPGPALVALWSAPGERTDWPDPLSEVAEDKYVGKLPHSQAQPTVPTASTGSMKSLLDGHWHLVVHQVRGLQLYDWNSDPGELNNLVNTPYGQETAKALSGKMQDLMATSRAVRSQATVHKPMNGRTLEQK
jgi:arylsulfatase A-like enzyme